MNLGIIRVLAVALAANASETSNAEVHRHDKSLAGSWQATSMEKNGEAAPEDAVRRMRFRFSGEHLFIRGNAERADPSGDAEEECPYTVDTRQDPKHLDFTPPGKEKAVLAIYECEDQVLRVCLRYASSEAGRPRDFATEPGSDLVLIVFRKEDPGQTPRPDSLK